MTFSKILLPVSCGISCKVKDKTFSISAVIRKDQIMLFIHIPGIYYMAKGEGGFSACIIVCFTPLFLQEIVNLWLLVCNWCDRLQPSYKSDGTATKSRVELTQFSQTAKFQGQYCTMSWEAERMSPSFHIMLVYATYRPSNTGSVVFGYVPQFWGAFSPI